MKRHEDFYIKETIGEKLLREDKGTRYYTMEEVVIDGNIDLTRATIYLKLSEDYTDIVKDIYSRESLFKARKNAAYGGMDIFSDKHIKVDDIAEALNTERVTWFIVLKDNIMPLRSKKELYRFINYYKEGSELIENGVKVKIFVE